MKVAILPHTLKPVGSLSRFVVKNHPPEFRRRKPKLLFLRGNAAESNRLAGTCCVTAVNKLMMGHAQVNNPLIRPLKLSPL